MNLSKFQEKVKDRGTWHAAVHGVAKRWKWTTAYFMTQLSHPHMTTEKTIALTIQTFVNKVISLLFNMLSRFVIAFLSKSKCLLNSWLQSPSTVILESKKIKSSLLPFFSHLFAPSIALAFGQFLSKLQIPIQASLPQDNLLWIVGSVQCSVTHTQCMSFCSCVSDY